MPKENRNPDRSAPTVTNDLLARLVELATETNQLLAQLLEPYTTDDIGLADDDAGDDGKTKAKADAKTKAADKAAAKAGHPTPRSATTDAPFAKAQTA